MGEPENTLCSIRRAIDLGADQIEIDTHLTYDRQVVVIHDETVDRTTEGKGKVQNYTLEELRALDAGSGERVPTLREVIELVRGKAILRVELKGRGVEDSVVQIIKESDMVEDVVLTSFRHNAVKRAKALESRIRTGVLFVCSPINPTRLAHDAQANNLHPNVDYLDATLVRSAHQEGLGVFIWNANTEETAKEMLKLGVDGIGTDRLDIVLPIVDRGP